MQVLRAVFSQRESYQRALLDSQSLANTEMQYKVTGTRVSIAAKHQLDGICTPRENKRFFTLREHEAPSVPGPSSGDRFSGALAGCGGGVSTAFVLLLVVVAATATALLWRPGLFLSHMFTALLL